MTEALRGSRFPSDKPNVANAPKPFRPYASLPRGARWKLPPKLDPKEWDEIVERFAAGEHPEDLLQRHPRSSACPVRASEGAHGAQR